MENSTKLSDEKKEKLVNELLIYMKNELEAKGCRYNACFFNFAMEQGKSSAERKGMRNMLPMVERMVFGLYKSTVVLLAITAVTPAPSAVRSIVPRFPGS